MVQHTGLFGLVCSTGKVNMSREQQADAILPLTCAWCGKHIREDGEIFSLGVGILTTIDLEDREGRLIPVTLSLMDKTVSAIVTAKDSQAKKEGKDLAFPLCSQACGRSLRAALRTEIIRFDMVDAVGYPLD